MRINKFIAHSGYCSRRKAEEYILRGDVTANGTVINELSYQVKDDDIIKIKGETIKAVTAFEYYMVNKPIGTLSSCEDPHHERFVTDLVQSSKARLYPVGRLDMDSRGLILLTNDGDLTKKLTHPSHDIDKTYHVTVKGLPTEEDCCNFARGLYLDNVRTRPCQIIKLKQTERMTIFEVVLKEGRNRQIRRMFEALGFRVVDLQRIKIGTISLGSLKEGDSRPLTKNEIEYLKEFQ